METAIVTNDLTKVYKEVTAVEKLSLNVTKGEIYCFLGLNGAGKTTTIRMLLGMISPTAGEAFVLGQKVMPDLPQVWSKVGYIVEIPYAYPELTVRQNLEAVRRLRLMDDPKAVDRIIDRLGLGIYADRKTKNLSQGNAQRLGLAKALIHEPDILILDEPANGLDPEGIVEIRQMLQTLSREQGVTVFMSSHNLAEVARVVDRLGIIHDGRLIQELDARELDERRLSWLSVDCRNNEEALKLLKEAGNEGRLDSRGFIALSDKAAVNNPGDIASLLVQKGQPPTRLIVEEEELEEYFLRLVGIEREQL